MGNRIFVVAGLVCLLSTSARATQGNAPPPPAAQKAFAAGKKLYDAGDKKGAVEKFKEAYRVSRNPLLLYNIGLVYDEIGDKMLALHYYALFIDKAKTFPKAAENRKLASDRIVAIKGEMDAAAKPTPAPAEHAEAPVPADRPRARAVGKFTHETIDSADAGQKLEILARAPQGYTVTLYYRKPGAENYASEKMSNQNGTLVGYVPAKVVSGSTVQYYLEARNGQGQVVDRSGDAGSPNLVMVDGGKDDPLASMNEEPSHAEDDTGDGRMSPYLKWGVTGAAGALLAGAVISYVTSNNYASALKDEYSYTCTQEPCSPSTDYERDLAAGRDRWKTITWVSAGVGVATAGVAGYLWYKDAKAGSRHHDKVAATPVVGDGYVGAAALISF